jgi:hypothetical protein
MHEIDYGNLTKRIVFTENDHRHAKLLIRLKHDGLRQSDFFRCVITGYLEGAEHMQNFVDEIKQQSKKHTTKSRQLQAKGKEATKKIGLDKKEIENIFDLLEEEHPEL